MNRNEIRYFSKEELKLHDATSLPLSYLLKSLWIKMRRRTWGRLSDRKASLAWTVNEVSDAAGPADNVRNYLERRQLRLIMAELVRQQPIRSACEVGCGYGRLTMVLGEFAEKIVGFEREEYLVDIARRLLPAITFCKVDSLDSLSKFDKGAFDFVLTCTVLQHLTDDLCRSTLAEIKRIAPNGHVLLIEKTGNIATTKNIANGDAFISRARTPQEYAGWMRPYNLVSVTKRIVEPTYYNPEPGSCMLFRSPSFDKR